MAEHVSEDEASYFLFKIAPKSWILINYVPDATVVKDKMVYASAKATLKDKLGSGNFEEEVHVTSKTEFVYDTYQSEKKTGDARSNFEVEHENVILGENEAREQYAQQISQKEKAVQTGGTGGYHTVSMPLSADAKSVLDRLKSGDVNFVTLAVDEAKTSINSAGSGKVDVAQVGKEINLMEPRFYLYSQVGKLTVFVYCCPEKAPPKWRMVYATSKPSVIAQVSQYGINLSPKSVEIRDGTELKEELQDAQTSNVKPASVLRGGSTPNMTGRMIQPLPGSRPLEDMGGVVKAKNASVVGGGQQHMVYGLMTGGQGSTASTKKKIVIPPRAAWNG